MALQRARGGSSIRQIRLAWHRYKASLASLKFDNKIHRCTIIHIWRCIMRTNIVLNDKLVKEAFKYTNASSKRELIDLALREFVKNHRKRDVRDLLGKVNIDNEYDYKALRTEKDKQ